MNIINNIKKTIAVTLLGGGMPLFIIFICLAILLTSFSVSSDDAYAEREGMQTIELFIQIANNEYETCGNVKGGDNIENGIQVLRMVHHGVQHSSLTSLTKQIF